MSDHEWRPVVGYEGVYEVRPGADGGAVRRIKKAKETGGGWGSIGKELGRRPRPDGYHRVLLTRPGEPYRRRLYYVHILILEAFKGPCPPGMMSLHYDDVKGNNTLKNLRWGTRSQNLKDSWDNVRRL